MPEPSTSSYPKLHLEEGVTPAIHAGSSIVKAAATQADVEGPQFLKIRKELQAARFGRRLQASGKHCRDCTAPCAYMRPVIPTADVLHVIGPGGYYAHETEGEHAGSNTAGGPCTILYGRTGAETPTNW